MLATCLLHEYLKDFQMWQNCFLESRKYRCAIHNYVNICHLEIFTSLFQHLLFPFVCNVFQPQAAHAEMWWSATKGV